MARNRNYGDDYDSAQGELGADAIRSPKDPVHFAGVTPQTIAPASSLTFTVGLNMDMNIRQLIIPDEFASKCVVTAASIGPIQLNAGDGPMPGDAFRRDSTMRFSPAVPATTNQPLKVTIANIDSAALTNFRFGVVGPVKRAG